jgi:anti-sigma factor RsiW
MDYLEGVLSADLRSVLDAHIAGCPRCVAFIASYRETPRILREATAAALPADLQASLQAFLRAQRRVPPAEN